MSIPKRVLVIDDSQSIREQIAVALETLGVEIVEAENGQEGIDIIKRDKHISMVFADINMPYINGVEMLQKVQREIEKGLPVIMLTTESEPALVQKAKAYGAKGWMVKPFKANQLISVVEKLSR